MTLLEDVKSLVGKNILLLFGPPGSGKTTFCIEVAKESKRALYIDTEYGVDDPESVPADFARAPNLDELKKILKEAGDYEVIIVDSIGMLIYPQLSRASLKERSEIFLDRGAIMFMLREMAVLHNKLVILTTQPDYFGGTGGLEGAKYLHLAKEIWRHSIVASNPNATTINIETYRSRRFGQGKPLYQLKITSNGVEVKKKW